MAPGIGAGYVVALVGRTDMSMGGCRKIVLWIYTPASEEPVTITTLTFELGRLVEGERKVIRTQGCRGLHAVACDPPSQSRSQPATVAVVGKPRAESA